MCISSPRGTILSGCAISVATTFRAIRWCLSYLMVTGENLYFYVNPQVISDEVLAYLESLACVHPSVQ